MMYLTFSFISLMVSILFMTMKHPLAMGMTLIIQSLIVSMIVGLISKTFWFSYIIFLVFLGGILILFIYISSLASNELFFFSFKKIFFMIISLFFLLLLFFFIDKNFIYFFMENLEMKPMSNMFIFIKENNLMLSKLYNFPINMITILLINYLFLTLIIAVKITNLYKGPLRSNIM